MIRSSRSRQFTYNTNMDKRLKHEKISRVLRTEHEKHPPSRRAVHVDQRDSAESDTESLAHERAYQQHVGRHVQNKHLLPQQENADSLHRSNVEDEDACNVEETEHHQLYDSLDAAAHSCATRNCTQLQTKCLDTLTDEREGTNQLLTDDAYSELRYEPNWRSNLRGAGCFNESPQIPTEEHSYVRKEKSSQSCGDSEGLKGGYRYIVDTSPAVVTSHITGNDFDQPFSLHPEDGQTGSGQNQALQRRSPEPDHSKPSCIITKNESVWKVFGKKSGNVRMSPELTQDIPAVYIQDLKTYYLHKPSATQGGATPLQPMSTSAFPKVLTGNIVERNKRTLGRNTSKRGSYVSVHSRKQEIPHNNNKVTQISEGKKALRKGYHNPPQHQQQRPPAREVNAERGDCLSSPLARPAAGTQPNPQKTTSSQPLLPAIHLNPNASSHLLPLVQQWGQDDIINLASLPHDCPHWNATSENELTFSPGTEPAMSSTMSRKGVNTHLHHRSLEGSPEKWQRTTALKWPLSREGEDLKCPNEVHTRRFPQNLPRTPSTTTSLASAAYTVLPPIGKPMTGEELSPGENTAVPIQRSSSDSYLAQMEKQKQLRGRVPYKAYSLKDYKQLKSDIILRGGLGPDHTAIEKTKKRQQKLYSNVIREQNKKISRIPLRLAKDPEGKEVPRMKALEYAKTISKPPVQSQPKPRQKHGSEGSTEDAPYLDVSQMATLEVLRKRHEEEKQAVALFRKVHAV